MAGQYSFTCDIDGVEIHGKTEKELIENVKQHAHSRHGQELTDEQVRQMIQEEQAQARR